MIDLVFFVERGLVAGDDGCFVNHHHVTAKLGQSGAFLIVDPVRGDIGEFNALLLHFGSGPSCMILGDGAFSDQSLIIFALRSKGEDTFRSADAFGLTRAQLIYIRKSEFKLSRGFSDILAATAAWLNAGFGVTSAFLDRAFRTGSGQAEFEPIGQASQL